MTGSVFPWLVLLRDLSVKSALLLLAAWALTLAMRRAAAAARHLVWLLTFAGLLLLPLLSMILPARSVAVLPPPAAPFVSLGGPLAPTPIKPNSGGTGEGGTGEAEARAAGRAGLDPSGSPRIGGGGAIPYAPSAPPPATPDWLLFLCLLWLLGVALAALPFLAGWLLAARRIRRCSTVTDPTTLALAAEAGHLFSLRRPISLRSGPLVSVPVTFGLICPVILLPDGAASWPAERLRVALLHEMAHVKRGDWATQTMARLVCALFWHIPLVWPAARMLRAEAERACDDLVLSSGIPAPDYAQHLLAVAAALSGANRPLPLAVPMAGHGPLESRLRAVLIARPRRAPSRRLAILAFALALVVLVPLAVLHPAARAARRIAPPLTLAPVVLPAPPKIVRPSPAPSQTIVAALHTPTKPTPIGVLPMKPLTPAKTVALAALAATLTLPAAQAKPTAPVKLPPASALAATLQREMLVRDLIAKTKAYPTVPAPGVFYWMHMPVPQATLKAVMALTPWARGKTPDGVKRIFFLMGNNAILVNATPAGYAEVQRQVKLIAAQLLDAANPRPDVEKAFGDVTKAMAAPRQVQIKFEWVSSAGTPNAALDKSVDALTIVAEEGRKAQVSSQHLRNGTGGEETITVLPHLEPGGVVVLDITERSDSTAQVGDTKGSSAETTVRVKDGETGMVRLQVSKQGGQGVERALFVTPTILHAAADGSIAPRAAPLRDGDAVNVNSAEPGGGPGFYKVSPPLNLTVPRLIDPASPTNRRPANPVPGTTP